MFKSIATAVLVVLSLLVTDAAGNYITYTECTDKALCMSGCQSGSAPTKSCQANGNGSQIFKCHEQVGACGDFAYFSDSACTNLMMTDGFVCDKCNGKSRVRCLAENRKQYLGLDICDAGGCGTCVQYQNFSAGDCVPTNNKVSHANGLVLPQQGNNGGGQLYMKYTGATVCTGVQLMQWENNVDCSGAPTATPWVPMDMCMNGVKIGCTFN